jgi:ectoine hydroxylase-related dioxygenase (phytanoyl-CoA dioxygenase family)
MSPPGVSGSLEFDGFEIVRDVIDGAGVDVLCEVVAALPDRLRGGARNLLQRSNEIAALAVFTPLKRIADSALQADAFPVRALFFDKPPEANWKVPWHQDLAIAVAERRDAPGFAAWSVKDGVPHVHAPASVLERMIALRIHLDDSGEDNGPLRVIRGSHRSRKLSPEEIERWKRDDEVIVCTARRGDVIAMRPLLLHASSPARTPVHRRVIHIEYAAGPLPFGLRWFVETTL